MWAPCQDNAALLLKKRELPRPDWPLIFNISSAAYLPFPGGRRSALKTCFEVSPGPRVDRPVASLCCTRRQLDPGSQTPTASPPSPHSFLPEKGTRSQSTLCSASWSESDECWCSYCRPWPSLCLCDLPPGTCWGRCTARCSTVNGWQEKTWQQSTARERCETQSPWWRSLELNGSSNSEFKRWRKMWRGQKEDRGTRWRTEDRGQKKYSKPLILEILHSKVKFLYSEVYLNKRTLSIISKYSLNSKYTRFL